MGLHCSQGSPPRSGHDPPDLTIEDLRRPRRKTATDAAGDCHDVSMQKMTARRRLSLIAVIAVLTFAAMLSFRHVGGTRLVTDTQGSGSASSSMAPAVRVGDRFYVAYGGSVCVKHGGLATVTSIEPRDAHGGLEVSGFSVFQRPSLHPILGAAPGRLADIPDFRGGETVASACGKPPFKEIAIEFYKPEAKDAWASDFTVHYLAGGRERTTNIQLGVALCEKEGCHPHRDPSD
jgi:hypothetical protein